MKLYYSPNSPYVRKVLVVAHEAGLLDKIQLLKSAADPVKRDAEVVAANPLGQVPTLLTADDFAISDSRVICEYLDSMAGTGLFPVADEPRWQALVHQSTVDGMLSAALLCRYERITRPEAYQWQGWYDGQFAKISSVLAHFDRCASGFGAKVDIGTISIACGLSYLDHRFGDDNWQSKHASLARWFEQFSDRPSMHATKLGVSDAGVVRPAS